MRRTIDTGSVVTEAEYLRVRTLVMGPDRLDEDRLLAQAGVPPRFLHAAHPRAVEVGNALLEGRNAYLCGPVGTFKTTLACAALRQVVRHGAACRFLPTRRLLDELKASFRDGSDVLAAYSGTPVLVLDDLGKEPAKGWCLERLFALVDERHNRMLPTLVTTQYEPGALIARLAREGDRDTATAIVSRLRQNCLKVATEGRDTRAPERGQR